MKRTAGRNLAAANTVILFFDLCMLFSSAALYQGGLVDFTGVLVPTVALFSSFGPAVVLANLGSTLQNTFAAGNRVLDILDETPVINEVTGQEKTEFDGAAAENVSFSYGNPAEKEWTDRRLTDKKLADKKWRRDMASVDRVPEREEVLDGVSLEIPKGKIIGLVGKSGSGKSTLLKLFMRLWDVQGGSIRISGKDVAKINTFDLRDMESLMTQETHLFHDSIKNNLRIAKPDAADGEIEAACRKASVHEFIMSLPGGYDTPVGELGDTLSGGERQRLGLARAFLHDAPFLLLDEPTSSLDSLNEAVILKSLYEEREGKTVLLVSHRQSTMRIADTVYSVESLSQTGMRMS